MYGLKTPIVIGAHQLEDKLFQIDLVENKLGLHSSQRSEYFDFRLRICSKSKNKWIIPSLLSVFSTLPETIQNQILKHVIVKFLMSDQQVGV